MEKKKVKDTTKEDHYVEIAVGFKIIYNQNQYLAYTEVPKKKKDIRLEIYIGRVSLLKDQYLLFKCETDSERRQVFSYFKQVFSGEPSNEIEPVDFSMIERMSIVSSDLFDEKMDQYPNFFTLPKKEEIDANITLPSFLMKKSSKIEKQPDEIQFVGNSDEVLESNVETPAMPIKTEIPDEKIVSTIINSEENVINEETQNNNIEQELQDDNSDQTIESDSIPTDVVLNLNGQEGQNNLNMTEEQKSVSNNVTTNFEVNSVMTEKPTNTGPNITSTQNLQDSIDAPEIPSSKTEISMNNQNIGGVLSVEPILNTETPIEETVKFEQIYDDNKKKKMGRTSIIILMIITLLLIASIAIVYVFIIEPKMKEQETNKPNTPSVVNPDEPKTSNLVCTIETENEDSLEEKEIIFVYDNKSKNILSSKEHTTVTMYGADLYMERKAMVKVFSQELSNTEGQKYTFQYDDQKYIYQVWIDRNYEKVAEEEKDETWKQTFDEANDYYLKEGYTCNGKKQEKPIGERKLTSMTENDTVDYNNWIVTYQKSILSEDKEVLLITLEVKNNSGEVRTLNGELKLFDENNQIVRKSKLNQQVEANETSIVVVQIKSSNENENPELGSLERIDLETITQYLVELYRE